MVNDAQQLTNKLQHVSQRLGNHPHHTQALIDATHEAAGDTSELDGLDPNTRLQRIAEKFVPLISGSEKFRGAAGQLDQAEGTGGIRPMMDAADWGFIIILILFL